MIEQSASDDRKYHWFTLSNNGLRCLVISDPTTDKASAALDVHVGQYSDGNVPGIAHYLEHMLFMGTTKYPDENDYQAYLTSHGGSSNAFTDLENTNYFFDVSAGNLEGALDRFAQFFISPLLKQDSLERERQAVDSEHAKNLHNDYWRLFQLTKSEALANPEHPFYGFGSGNATTLDIPDIRESLLKFYQEHYSASDMALVVLGKESLEELQEWVTTYFSDIPTPDSYQPLQPPTVKPFLNLPKRVHVIPVREHTKSLNLSFPLPEMQSHYRSKPTHYLSHLLGHEGQGSVLSLLKEKRWAHELSAGDSRSCSDFCSFDVGIQLTDAGLEHVDEVVEVVFAYLNNLRSVGPQEWVYEETSTVADCSFRFLSKRNPMD